MNPTEEHAFSEAWPCDGCGYDLRGCQRARFVRCPECGRSQRALSPAVRSRRLADAGIAVNLAIICGTSTSVAALTCIGPAFALPFVFVFIAIGLPATIVSLVSIALFRYVCQPRRGWHLAFVNVAFLSAPALAVLAVALPPIFLIATNVANAAPRSSSLRALTLWMIASIAAAIASVLTVWVLLRTLRWFGLRMMLRELTPK